MTQIAVFNQKGGVGKTTTTLNLSAALARRGYSPLSIDLDPQGHLSSIVGAQVNSAEDSIFAFYQDIRSLGQLLRRSTGGWDVIPAHIELSKVDTQFGKGPNILSKLKNGIARDRLNSTRPLVIDCCPMLGVLSLSAIFAADRVLIPVSADYLAVKGVMQVEKTLRALEHVLKKRVQRRYLMTRFDSRRKMSHEIFASIAEHFGDDLCKTRIFESVSVAESPAANTDVFTHAPNSRGALDYMALLDELIECGFIEEPPEAVETREETTLPALHPVMSVPALSAVA
jgi:chromosome partitioning protein